MFMMLELNLRPLDQKTSALHNELPQISVRVSFYKTHIHIVVTQFVQIIFIAALFHVSQLFWAYQLYLTIRNKGLLPSPPPLKHIPFHLKYKIALICMARIIVKKAWRSCNVCAQSARCWGFKPQVWFHFFYVSNPQVELTYYKI